MNIFQKIADAITCDNVLLLELSKDENGVVAMSNSLNGIPVDIDYISYGDVTRYDVITVDNSINDFID